MAFVPDVGISVGLGVVFGVVLALLISTRRAGVWRESAPLAVAVVVAASFVSIDFAGGSGYLGAFLAGLIVSNMGMGVPDAELVTVTVALALVVTVLLQTTTKPWLARRLHLLEPGAEP